MLGGGGPITCQGLDSLLLLAVNPAVDHLTKDQAVLSGHWFTVPLLRAAPPCVKMT